MSDSDVRVGGPHSSYLVSNVAWRHRRSHYTQVVSDSDIVAVGSASTFMDMSDMRDATANVLDRDAIGQAAALRAGELSPLELVDAAIARVEELNPTVNAIIHERFAKARVEAERTEPGSAPFAGVPMVVKDLGAAIAGEPHYRGTRGLKAADFRSPTDSFIYAKLRAAGFIVMGRTNTPEFGTTITTEPLSYGPSRNPWNTNHSTGGSSGGSAAAVASRMVAVGHANDGGGSIRIPASECGLVGLKPTRARVSQGPAVGDNWMGATIDGSVTRTVRDTAAMLDVLHGPMPGDPYAAPTPQRAFALEVGADPGRLRIGIHPHARPGMTSDAACVSAVNHAGQLLSQLGHSVEHATPEAMFDEEFSGHFVHILVSCVARDVADMEAMLGRPIAEGDLEPENAFFAAMGQQTTASAYLQAVSWMHGFQRRMAMFWADEAAGGDGFDLFVTPTIGIEPPPIGWISDPSAVRGSRVRQVMQYTPQFNITGQPAISLPLFRSESGLPVGVQLVAAYGREDVLLRVASQLEAVAPWPQVSP